MRFTFKKKKKPSPKEIMAFIYLSQFQGQPMITYQTQEKKMDYINVALS